MDQQVSNKDRKNSPLKDTVKSSMLKAGAKTIFFDVYLASNDKQSFSANKKYLKITSSGFSGEDKIRSSFVLFPEDVDGFQKNLKEIIGYL